MRVSTQYELAIIIVVSIIVSFFIISCFYKDKNKEYKYSIHSSDGLTILIDKENGLTWRNCFCDNNEKIPHCWALMEYRGAVVPDGDEERRANEFKMIKEQHGLK